MAVRLTNVLTRTLLSAVLLSVAVARAEESSAVLGTEEEWQLLLNIQKQVPGFAGFAPVSLDGTPKTYALSLLLLFPNLNEQALTAVKQGFPGVSGWDGHKNSPQ